MAFAAAIPLITSAVKMASGAIQSSRGRPEKQDYRIPDEMYQILENVRERMDMGAPGVDTMKENLQTQSAAQMGQLRDVASGSGLLMGATRLNEDVLSGMRDIDFFNEQYKERAGQMENQALQSIAREKEKAYYQNEQLPYEEKLNEFYNSRVAGQTNMFSGLTELGEYGMAVESNKKLDGMLDRLFSGDGHINSMESIMKTELPETVPMELAKQSSPYSGSMSNTLDPEERAYRTNFYNSL